MKNEGLFLVAFILLAIILLVMVSRSERERFEPEPDSVIRIGKLEEDVQLLDDRVGTIETKQKKQDDELAKAQADVDVAATQIQMVA